MKSLFAFAALFCAISFGANAQFKNLLKKAAGELDSNPVQAMPKKPAPITTSLPDARWAVDSMDAFAPKEAKQDLTALPRTPNGGFVLQPGYYEFHDQSYCLKAGTHGPGGGDGYLFAPPLGPQQEVVTAIVRNSVSHPDIAQHDIQLLLWSIIARAKFSDLQTGLKAVAALLLTPKQLVQLNGGAMGLIPDALMQKGMEGLPSGVRTVLEAENKLRGMLTSANSSYEEMERVAVLAGLAPRGEGSLDVPNGRWSQHPDGYYVRYLPSSYTNTVVNIWVPQGSGAAGKEYDPAAHIAVPGNTSRQRLIQSGRAYQ